MIAELTGKLVEKGVDYIVLNVGGVGFRVAVSLHTQTSLPETGAQVRLLTHLVVREDALLLFGFATAEERVAFEVCINVQQVGPKLALAILSTLSPSELARAVRAGDAARLRRIPGVGPKTAERLALELRDKVDRFAAVAQANQTGAVSASDRSRGTVDQVVSALVNLGYRAPEATRVVEKLVTDDPNVAVGEWVKKALRTLAE